MYTSRRLQHIQHKMHRRNISESIVGNKYLLSDKMQQKPPPKRVETKKVIDTRVIGRQNMP